MSTGEFSNLSSDRAEILARVDPIVVETIGPDNIYDLELSISLLAAAKEASAFIDPFSKPKTYDDEFSFLDPGEKAQLNEFLTIKSRPKGRKELKAGLYSGAAFSRARHWEGLAFNISENLRSQRTGAKEGLNLVGESLRELGERQDKGEIILEELLEQAAKLEELASQLPSEKATALLEDLYKVPLSINRELVSRPWLSKAGRLLKSQVKRNERNLEIAKTQTVRTRQVRKLGKATHNLFRAAVTVEGVGVAVVSLDIMHEIYSQLQERLTSGEETELLAAEQYLVSKLEQSEKLIKSFTPEILRNSDVASFVSLLKSLPISQSQRIRLETEAREKSGVLSKQLTEARDIVRGGLRLEPTKEMPNPKKIANELHALAVDNRGTKLLNVEQQGLLIAMASGRFDSFLAVLAEIREGSSETAQFLAQDRASVVEEVSRFKEEECVASLLDIIYDSGFRRLLNSVFSQDQLAKIEEAIALYLNPELSYQPDQVIEDEQITEETAIKQPAPQEIEDVLTPAELIGELDWTVLPYGESGEQDLEQAAKEIVEAAKARVERGENVELDLERLEILRNIRRLWGPDRCHYERGSLKDRGKIVINGQERPDEYIVLVLQQLDGAGNVLMEHAIAESPIAGPNALYIFRADTTPSNSFTWRQVFAVSKKDAREIGGARRLKHTKGDGRPVVEVLTDRVKRLFDCPVEDFHRIRFQQAGAWLSRRIGRAAIS